MELMNTILPQTNTIEELKYRRERLAKKIEDIKGLQFEKSLMVLDIIKYIQTELNQSNCNPFYPLRTPDFEKVFRLFHGDVKDNEENRAVYDYVLKIIQEKFLSDLAEFKLIDILDYNYGQSYAFVYEYSYKEKTYKIEVNIPVLERVDLSNYEYVAFSVSYQSSEYVWDMITYSLDYKEVQEGLKKWMKKR